MRARRYTLIEILVVITIMIILAGMTLAAAKFVQKKAMLTRTRTLLESIAAALNQYQSEYGFFPEQADAAEPTLKKAMLDGMLKSNGVKYLDWSGEEHTTDASGNCLDPIGEPFYYVCPGNVNPESFDLWSKGWDQKHGNNGAYWQAAQTRDDNDDVTNWKRGP